MAPEALRMALRQVVEIEKEEESLLVSSFNADDAFLIGTSIRQRLRDLSQSPAVVNITLANNHTVFHAVSRPGTMPDHDVWIRRKRNAVQRWGMSTWLLHTKMEGSQEAFRQRFGIGASNEDYSIFGGGVPVRVKGVGLVVAVIVVSGLKPDEDHQVIVEALEEFIRKGSVAKE